MLILIMVISQQVFLYKQRSFALYRNIEYETMYYHRNSFDRLLEYKYINHKKREKALNTIIKCLSKINRFPSEKEYDHLYQITIVARFKI